MTKPVQMTRMVVDLPPTKTHDTREQRLNTFSSYNSVSPFTSVTLAASGGGTSERGRCFHLLPQGLAPWIAAPEGNRRLQVCGWQNRGGGSAYKGEREWDTVRDERDERAAERSVAGQPMVHNGSGDRKSAYGRDERPVERSMEARHTACIGGDERAAEQRVAA